MLKFLFIGFIVAIYPLYAGVRITPNDAILKNFGADVLVTKKSILLTKAQSVEITKTAQMKLSTKLYRAFIIKKEQEIVGYAVLMNEKVRSKNAAVLYMITPNSTIKAIEIVAFNEPPEYMPSDIWIQQFKDKDSSFELRIGKDIPTITGATLSARNIADGSRVALAITQAVLAK